MSRLISVVPVWLDAQIGKRGRLALMTTAASLVNQVVTVACSFLVIRLSIAQLGADGYGTVVLLTSFLSLITFADLGLGNGLLSFVASSFGKGDQIAMRKGISTAFFTLSAISIAFLGFVLTTNMAINWPGLLVGKVERANEGLLLVLVTFCLSLPFGIVSRVNLGLQEGYRNNLWSIIGSLVSLACAILGIILSMGPIYYIGAILVGPLSATFLSFADRFIRLSPTLRPSRQFAEGAVAKRIVRSGKWFLVIQLSAIAAYQTDALVIGHFLGPEAVAQYAVSLKIFMILPMIMSFVLIPLWPAYAEAISSNDIEWVRQTLRRSIYISLGVSLGGLLILTPSSRFLVGVLSDHKISLSTSLLVGLSAYVIVNSLNSPIAYAMNGFSLERAQAKAAVVMATANLFISAMLVRHVGPAGAIWGTVVAQTLFGLLPCTIIVRNHCRTVLPRLSSSYGELGYERSE